jgi:hypothetical protein
MGSPEFPSEGCIYTGCVFAIIGLICVSAAIVWGLYWLINHIHISIA